MPTKASTARLAESLRSLAECQLQMQTVRSAALDGGALGVMAVDAGVAAIVIGTRGGYDLWILAQDIRTNRQALAHKAPLFDQALTSLVLAIMIELAGRLQ